MSSCNVSIDDFQRADSTFDVSEKYTQLMQDTLADDSLYMRVKDTLLYQFEDLQLTEKEKASFSVDFMSKVAVELSKVSLATAMAWAKEERDGEYTLAKIKADTEQALASKELIAEQICEIQKKKDMLCAQIEVAIAGSIRDNGTVAGYDPDDPCKPMYLNNEGLKYQQTLQVEAATYQIFADAYRKSGVVDIGVDNADQVLKGLSGTTHDQSGETAGYTAQQTANAERQRIAYEDSKRNHAANSSASMIGQMLSAEVPSNAQDVDAWRAAIAYLNTSHSTTAQG